MTAKEAIEKLEREKAIMCHGCMHPQMVGWCEDHCQMPEALDIAIEALQEQSRDCMWVCPNCGLDVHVDYDRCVRCGERREP